MYFVNSKFESKINPFRDAMNKSENVVSEIVYDTISNITTIKMLSLSGLVHNSLKKQIDIKFHALKKKAVLNEIKWTMPSLFGGVMTQMVLLFYILNAYYMGTAVMIGTLYILYGFLQKLQNVMENIAWLMSNIQDEARDIVNSELLSDNFSKINNQNVKQISGIESLEISNLHFRYSEAFDLSIESLKLDKGKSYAFVGESGCGKTTTMKILASLVECEGYTMRVQPFPPYGHLPQGKDSTQNKFSVASLGEAPRSGEGVVLENIRDSVMLIPQEPELFSNSVRENITLGLPYTEKEVNKVLDMVNMRETVDGLPEGIESKVYEKGVNLSGGQKQRLALARGILFARDKEIILLDEPTSSVDQDNEERIYKELLALAKDKILISSVHKRNLLSMFDHIVYFEKGKIVRVE